MGCTYNTIFYITCDNCGAIEQKYGYMEYAISGIRKKGWLVRRIKHGHPAYKRGEDNHLYYCPNCKGLTND